MGLVRKAGIVVEGHILADPDFGVAADQAAMDGISQAAMQAVAGTHGFNPRRTYWYFSREPGDPGMTQAEADSRAIAILDVAAMFLTSVPEWATQRREAAVAHIKSAMALLEGEQGGAE